MISNFQDIPTFTTLKSHLLSLIRTKIKSTFGIHDASFSIEGKFESIKKPERLHSFSDTHETCECNLGIEDIRHFLFECPFYAIQIVTLAVNVIAKEKLEPSRKSTGIVFIWAPLSSSH